MIVNEKEKLWVERHRPQTVDDCILKEQVKKEFKSIVEQGHIPNLLLHGPAGTGKTSIARALCNELGADYIIINASNERGLDVIREKVTAFASTASLTGSGTKCVILDEGDRLLPATQDAFKAEIERFSQTCSFIMTANHPNRLIDALHSRLVKVDFAPSEKEMERMQAQFYGRLCKILEYEGVKYDDGALIGVIQKLYPDNRRILGHLQQYARGDNYINEGILMQIEEASIDGLIKAMRQKKFKDILKWCANNANNDTSTVYEKIYEGLFDVMEKESIPDAILILEDYQRHDSSVPSKELHLAALGVELMTQTVFK
jgi:replication factor C small subunit